ncbi:hypothetical protein SM033_00152 [Vibrio phage vB_VpaM_sm033]|nr:hypothetical protein SM033_00152 [Vibrio phage vB_VpaM_sm033]
MSLEFLLDDVKAHKELVDVLDSESYASFESYFISVGGAIKKTLDWITNNHTTAEMADPISLASHMKTLEKMGFSALADVNVYKPPFAKTDWISYSKVLLEQTTQFSNLEFRLYAPFQEYLERAVALEGYHNKPITDRKFVHIDAVKARKQFERVNVNEDKIEELEAAQATVKFQKTFRSIRQLQDVEKLVFHIHETLATVNLDSLKKREVLILKEVDTLLDRIEADEKEDLTPAAKKQLAVTMMNIAEETEYLAMLLFYSNQTIAAWNDTAVKLRKIEP